MWYGEAVVRWQIVKITSGYVVTRVPLRLSRRSLANLVPRAHVPFGQHQDTELWNNQLVSRAFVAFAFKI